MTSLAIRGGQVVTDQGLRRLDILIEGGRVERVGPSLSGDRILDATGKLVGPGLVDMHVHFRDPGQTWKEDLESGSAAAASGGFTAVIAMPNTDPPTDKADLVSEMVARGRAIGLVDLRAAGAITKGRRGRELADLDGMRQAGAWIYSDDGDAVMDEALMRAALAFTRSNGGLVSQHAEDPQMAGNGHLHQGEVADRLGLPGLTSEAEESVVARDIDLLRLEGGCLHVQHVSTSGTVGLIRRAKAEGLAITSEVTPHHIWLDHEAVGSGDPNCKMYPPLRSAGDVADVREALVDGTIDVVATDHAPHTAKEKQAGFEAAPRGVIGLETSAALIWGLLQGNIRRFYQVMSVVPAQLSNLPEHGRWIEPGISANLMVFDPTAEWSVSKFVSRSTNSPFIGRMLRGRVDVTILNGRITHRRESA